MERHRDAAGRATDIRLATEADLPGLSALMAAGERLAGCGGWSRRATLYGGDHTNDVRDARLLDPATEPARVRAMYTHPDFVRRGVARAILGRCEAAAAAAGFRRVELMSTLAGEALYLEAGYRPIEPSGAKVGTVLVPLIRMGKLLARDDLTASRPQI